MAVIDYAIKVYTPEGKEQARLENAFDVGYELQLNGLWRASFKLPKDDPKIKYCKPFNLVELFDGGKRVELFRILPSVLYRSTTPYVAFECEHVLATLIDDVLFQYHQIGNVGVYTTQVLQYILGKQQTKYWSLGRCDFMRQFEYKWENENLLAALFSVPKPFTEDYVWRFNTRERPWRLSLERMDNSPVSDILYRKNLQGLEKTVDPTKLITRIYPLGYGEGDNQLTIKPINQGIPYLEKNVAQYGLKSSILVDRRFESAETLREYAQAVLDKACEPYVAYKVSAVDLTSVDARKYSGFTPGDMVRVLDQDVGEDFILPIVKVSKKDVVGAPHDVTIEIANKEENITGTLSEIMERARINDTYAQGATNLMQMTFADNADYEYPASFRFYIPQEAARINKVILRYTLEPFRAYSKAAKTKDLNITSTDSSAVKVGTTSYVGNKTDTPTSKAGEWSQEGRGHDHGLGRGLRFAAWVNGRAVDSGQAWVPSGQHTHKVEITIPGHDHSVTIPSHSHPIKIPGHGHEIEYGMYQGMKAMSADVIVDSTPIGATVDTKDGINIVPYLDKDEGGRIRRGTWHQVQIRPSSLTRIQGSLFVQLFTTSRGGGDY